MLKLDYPPILISRQREYALKMKLVLAVCPAFIPEKLQHSQSPVLKLRFVHRMIQLQQPWLG